MIVVLRWVLIRRVGRAWVGDWEEWVVYTGGLEMGHYTSDDCRATREKFHAVGDLDDILIYRE